MEGQGSTDGRASRTHREILTLTRVQMYPLVVPNTKTLRWSVNFKSSAFSCDRFHIGLQRGVVGVNVLNNLDLFIIVDILLFRNVFHLVLSCSDS